MTGPAPAPEFARPVRLDTIGGAPRTVTIDADAGECAALAIRFGIVRIDRLHASAALARDGDVINAEGRLVADVVQACVATGVDVAQAIDEPFALRFVPAAQAGADPTAEPGEVELDESELDVVTYAGGAIDLGEAAAQTLALALDPFPRAGDADDALRDAGVLSEEQAAAAQAGPFAKLIDLRDKLGG